MLLLHAVRALLLHVARVLLLHAARVLLLLHPTRVLFLHSAWVPLLHPLPLRERAGRGDLMPVGKIRIARTLRGRMTDAERILWQHLRAHRLIGKKFRRQQPLGPYIVDFICLEARLVIEVDGGQHQSCDADKTRDAWLETQGFRVLRFWNNEVLRNLPAVLEKVISLLLPSPQPSPAKGEGVQSGRAIVPSRAWGEDYSNTLPLGEDCSNSLPLEEDCSNPLPPGKDRLNPLPLGEGRGEGA
jgi:very-short-patch-repair endonuclease